MSPWKERESGASIVLYSQHCSHLRYAFYCWAGIDPSALQIVYTNYTSEFCPLVDLPLGLAMSFIHM